MKFQYRILTPGENATEALSSFRRIQEPVLDCAYEKGQVDAIAAINLVRASVRLQEQAPLGSRDLLARSMPFSEMEQRKFRERGWTEDNGLRKKVAERVGTWVLNSPVKVEGVERHCSDFLRWVTPCLDHDYERQNAQRIAEDLDKEFKMAEC